MSVMKTINCSSMGILGRVTILVVYVVNFTGLVIFMYVPQPNVSNCTQYLSALPFANEHHCLIHLEEIHVDTLWPSCYVDQ